MLRGLSGRVGRLESGQPDPCAECGWDGDWSKSEFVVEWDELDRDYEDPSDPAEPRWCETCGHQWEYVVTWLDLEEKE